MTTIELFHMLKIIFLIFGILFVIAAGFEFFAFNIKKIFQDITGMTQKREIKQMSENTEYTGQLKHHSQLKSNQKMMTNTGKLRNPNAGTTTGRLSGIRKKAHIEAPKAEAAVTETVQPDESATSVLGNEDATAVLGGDESATAVLSSTSQPVTTSGGDESETAVLGSVKAAPVTEPVRQQAPVEKGRKNIHFLLEKQILLIHTNEVIE